jgi:hypothetical protein
MPTLSAFVNTNERAVVPMHYGSIKHRAAPAVLLLDRLGPGVHTLPGVSSHSSGPSTAAVRDLGLIDEKRPCGTPAQGVKDTQILPMKM